MGACSRDSSWDGSGPQMGMEKKNGFFILTAKSQLDGPHVGLQILSICKSERQNPGEFGMQVQ